MRVGKRSLRVKRLRRGRRAMVELHNGYITPDKRIGVFRKFCISDRGARKDPRWFGESGVPDDGELSQLGHSVRVSEVSGGNRHSGGCLSLSRANRLVEA